MLEPKELPRKIPPGYKLPKVSSLGMDEAALFLLAPEGEEPEVSTRQAAGKAADAQTVSGGIIAGVVAGTGEKGSPPRQDGESRQLMNMMGDLKADVQGVIAAMNDKRQPVPIAGLRMRNRMTGLETTAVDEDAVVGPTEEELKLMYPSKMFGASGATAAERKATAALKQLPNSVLQLVHYDLKKNDFPGFGAKDLLDLWKPDVLSVLGAIDYKKCTWLKNYLQQMGASLQILGPLIVGENPPLAHVDDVVQQKVLIAMDCLSGAIMYGVLFLMDEYDENIRRGFLISGGRSFMSKERLERARERARIATEKTDSGAQARPLVVPTLPALAPAIIT